MNPDELRQLLEATADDEGRITCAGVVLAASVPTHPLHADPGFCWGDDAEAAHRHRLAHAGKLIRSVPCIIHPVQRRRARVPYFVRDPRTDEPEPGYVPLQSVPNVPGNAQRVVIDEMRRVVGILKRTVAVVAVLDMPDAAQELANLLAQAAALEAQFTAPVLMPAAG